MSKYTSELRWILEALTGESTPSKAIEQGRKHIFNFAYPFYKEEERESFETMFLRNFYTSEIGCETYELWKLRLNNWLNVNMPYYNDLLDKYLTLKGLNTYIDADYTDNDVLTRNETNESKQNTETEENQDRNAKQVISSESTSTEKHDATTNEQELASDTPQGTLENVLNASYLSNAKVNTSEAENNVSSSSRASTDKTDSETMQNNQTVSDLKTATTTNNEQRTYSRQGKMSSKTYSEMFEDYKRSIENWYKLIFHEMECLFMLLW